MKTTAIYPGTFDPITYGHLDIIERSAKLFDRVIVAVAASARKLPVLSLSQRTELVNLSVASFKNVETASYSGLLVQFAQEKKAQIIVRGLRAIADFEYELQLVNMNRKMAPSIETLFLAPAEKYTFISATIVREIMDMGGDLTPFVPLKVANALEKMRKKLKVKK